MYRQTKPTTTTEKKTEYYEQLLNKAEHKRYKKADREKANKTIDFDKRIATKTSFADRISITAEIEVFVTPKDHKDNFRNNPSCRLISPCKTEIGRISKQILENIVRDVKDKTKFNHWRSTKDAATWFDNINDKKRKSFIAFDINDFYPSITEDLLRNALDSATSYTNISEKQRHIIMHVKQSTLHEQRTMA